MMKLYKKLAISLMASIIAIPSIAFAEDEEQQGDITLNKIVSQKRNNETTFKVNYKTVHEFIKTHCIISLEQIVNRRRNKEIA